MDAGMISLLEAVKDVEKFHVVFVNTFADMVNKESSKAERLRARREWMAFMAENAVEFGQRWPELVSDLITWLQDVLERGKGGDNYLGSARTALRAIGEEGDT